ILDNLRSHSGRPIHRTNCFCPGYRCDSPSVRCCDYCCRVPSLPVRSDGWGRQQSVDVYCSRSSSCSGFSISALASSVGLLSISNSDSCQFVPALYQYDVHSTGEERLVEAFSRQGSLSRLRERVDLEKGFGSFDFIQDEFQCAAIQHASVSCRTSGGCRFSACATIPTCFFGG